MPDAREGRYQAYALLNELNVQISATMNQIAYGRMSVIEWEKTCRSHRLAFDKWMKFADRQAGEISVPREDDPNGS
ncbi:hypothetical protein LOY46_14390 [Pseudomonas sichuanensis]|uniref:hypothetical protein n=1 Tax=Pseudomonas sichuanensis TaxID=2213015 RepID=UPI00215E2DEA|nr:hypothetical protein [Pseudomonas sichuanensis]UVK80777.1 hypothetical protein LOY46_14390 [Pseudomonas sichuanensis]